jgi:hypothetical protein
MAKVGAETEVRYSLKSEKWRMKSAKWTEGGHTGRRARQFKLPHFAIFILHFSFSNEAGTPLTRPLTPHLISMPSSTPFWPVVSAVVKPGHRVASGLNENPRFPGGTLAMQGPFFARLGLDLGGYHSGTLNLSIAPHCHRVVQPRLTFRQVKWHPTEPAEDFSFFDCRLTMPGAEAVQALVYYPHPETKPEHFQSPDVLEILAPSLPGLVYGMQVMLTVDPAQMVIELASPPLDGGD